MGEVELIQRLHQAGRIALDTVVFIYAFERHPLYGPIAKTVFRALETGQCRAIVSVVALGEALTGAKKAGDARLASQYRTVFQYFPGIETVDVDRAIMEWASELRARYGVPMPDAIHLGTAIARGAPLFVTNDARFKQVTEIEALLLSEFLQGGTDVAGI
ncbi:MAG: type II toxin-antitoxin system VapC family toxin [Anaerolineae bacterium]